MYNYFTRSKTFDSLGGSKVQRLMVRAKKRLQALHILSISAGSAGSCLSSTDSSFGSSDSLEGAMCSTVTVKQETPT